jgi:hypothetical protein
MRWFAFLLALWVCAECWAWGQCDTTNEQPQTAVDELYSQTNILRASNSIRTVYETGSLKNSTVAAHQNGFLPADAYVVERLEMRCSAIKTVYNASEADKSAVWYECTQNLFYEMALAGNSSRRSQQWIDIFASPTHSYCPQPGQTNDTHPLETFLTITQNCAMNETCIQQQCHDELPRIQPSPSSARGLKKRSPGPHGEEFLTFMADTSLDILRPIIVLVSFLIVIPILTVFIWLPAVLIYWLTSGN